jgi:acyl transferase domain-containing protein
MSDTTLLDDLGPDHRALLVVRRLKARLQALEATRHEPVAIVGMGCRLPGGGTDPEAFWRLLDRGGDAVTTVPPERWDADAYYDPDPTAAGKIPSKWGAFVEGIDRFDPMFFGLSPREAALMDPQHRLLLEVAYEALEDAGVPVDALAGSRTGVFLGAYTTDYMGLLVRETVAEMHTGTGTDAAFAAGRLAHVLDLKGPCLSVDTLCSSSLVALHLAVQSLRSGESERAIVGGVNAMVDPAIQVVNARLGTLSPTGRCRAFDAGADGIVRGEGCCVVILRRLSDALADGDRIVALVRGTAINQDGRSARLTAPSGASQVELMRAALEQARLSPEQVSYIQTHGTGTPLGDPIEVDALRRVYGAPRPAGETCALASVKTNVGHLEAAAGVTGLLTVALAMKHQRIPPHIHFERLNPHISLDGTPFVIPVDGLPWQRGAEPRRAAVSSFGMSGSNAHVILEEPPLQAPALAWPERPWHLLTLAGHTEPALEELVQRWIERADAPDDAALADLAWSANTGRASQIHRLAVVVQTRAELPAALQQAWSKSGGAPRRGRARTPRPAVAFLFTGQGAQYSGMARQLYETSRTFRASLDRSAEILGPRLELPLLDVLFRGAGAPGLIDDTAFAQPALVAIEVALAELWRSMGVVPNAVLGHSVGEYAAAHVAGALSLEDALTLVAERGRLMSALPRNGAMWALTVPEADVVDVLKEEGGEVAIAGINGPADTVISGDADAVERIARHFEARGCAARRLTVSHAFHSPLMEPILDAFERAAGAVSVLPPQVPLVSNLTGRVADHALLAQPAYWRRHVREAVRFHDGIRHLAELDIGTFVELGPKPVLSGMAARCLPGGTQRFLPSLRQGQDDWRILLESAGELWVDGARVDLRGIDADFDRTRVAIPTYPFQRESYWYRRNAPARQAPEPQLFYERRWVPKARQAELGRGRWLVLLDENWHGADLALELAARGAEVLTAAPAPGWARTDAHSFALDMSSKDQWDRLLADTGPLDGVVHLLAMDSRWPTVASAAELLTSARGILESAFRLAQAGQDVRGTRPRLYFVTRGAHAAGGGPVDPLQTALWGYCTSLRLEDAAGWGGILDLAPDLTSLAPLAEELLGRDGEDMVALGTDGRRVLRLTPVSPTPTRQLAFPADATWLITGGLGALGLVTAKMLAGLGVRRFVLAGRSAPGETAARAIEELRAGGAQVVLSLGDIAREEDAARAIAAAGSALQGIVHGAGILDPIGLRAESWEHLERVMAAKVAGGFHLDRLSRQWAPHLEHFIMLSSAASTLGSSGDSAYAAANAWLDGLAHARRVEGLPAQTTCSSLWSGGGMGEHPAIERRFREVGVTPISMERGVAALQQVIASNRVEVTIADVDWRTYIDALRISTPLLADLVDMSSYGPAADATRADVVELSALDLEQLRAAAGPERARLLQTWLTDTVARLLRCRPADVEPDRSLSTMGLDSIVGLELKAAIDAQLNVSLPVVTILDGPSVLSLAELLLQELETARSTDSEPAVVAGD